MSVEYYMYKQYINKLKNIFRCGKDKASAELYIITGDTVVQMSNAELASIGIIFKIKGVLRDLKIGIHNKFVETTTDIDTVK